MRSNYRLAWGAREGIMGNMLQCTWDVSVTCCQAAFRCCLSPSVDVESAGSLEGFAWAQTGAFVFKQTPFRWLMFAHSTLKCTSCVKCFMYKLSSIDSKCTEYCINPYRLQNQTNMCCAKLQWNTISRTISFIWTRVSIEHLLFVSQTFNETIY